jgi:glycosyltransferase involved in cell wall biosynthesis
MPEPVRRVFVVNTGFSELDNLAAALAGAGLLSRYVRPYVNKGRGWERFLGSLPGAGDLHRRTFGRRLLPSGLSPEAVHEAGRIADFAVAIASRCLTAARLRPVRDGISRARMTALGRAGERLFGDEAAVVAGWGCAEPSFRKAKSGGSLRVLNYPLAHHRFTRRLLLEEADREPQFAPTLNSHDFAPWLERRFEREIAAADKILLGSSFARDSFVSEAVPVEKLTVVPYGVDTALYEPPPPAAGPRDQLRILFVGQIGQRKGISYLLRAYERFRRNGASLTMIGRIQGPPGALGAYRELFTHFDHMPRSQLSERYRMADVFVFPTVVDGMGLVVLEAMASGLPVICTANGPGDIVRDGVDGFIVPIRNVDAIVEKLEHLHANPQLRAWMGQNARQRALQFTWEAYRAAVLQRLRLWMHSQP